MAKKKLGLWSKDEIKILKKEFPNKSCEEVAKKLKRPLFAIKRKAYRLGIYKTKKYMKTLGRA